MIDNLPKKLSSKVVHDFVIGNQEAIRDELLDKCFCDIAPVRSYLKGNKDFLIGVKGSGKSAIFRQLVSKNIEFKNINKLDQIIIPIDKDVDYLAVKYHLQESLESSITDQDVRARFIWEIYILYKIVNSLLRSSIDIDSETKKALKSVESCFSFGSEKPSIIDIFTKANRTIGVKLDLSNPAMPAPDFYIKAEPSTKITGEGINVSSITLNIGDIQSKINSLLRRHKAIIYVLIDNLDDFLAREAYDAQRLVIQGLLACINGYSRHPYLKVKAFLRNEVFHKVDFEKIGGAEKIMPNATYLEWSATDIRRFIAERFIYNLLEVVKIDKFSIAFGEDELYRSRRLRRNKFIPKILWKPYCQLLQKNKNRNRNTLDITEKDLVWRTVITCFLPKEVMHFNGNGDLKDNLDIFEYIETHFCMANSKATPRALLIYLDKLIEISGSYYSERLYPEIELNEENEYPLFLKEHIQQAYGKLQDDLKNYYITSSVIHPEWKDRITSLLTNIGKKKEFSFRELKRLINYHESDQDAKELLAFLEHLGVLICHNKAVHLPDRSYSIPILLQKVA